MLLLWLFNIIKHTSWSEYCFMFVQCSSANIIHLSLSTQSSGWFSTWAKHRSYIPLLLLRMRKTRPVIAESGVAQSVSTCFCGNCSAVYSILNLKSHLLFVLRGWWLTAAGTNANVRQVKFQPSNVRSKCNREEMEWGQKLTLNPNPCYSLKAEYLKGLCTGDTGVNKNVFIQIHFSFSIS